MDANEMNESLGPAAVFPLGAENDAYAAYFTGQSYLAPLTGPDDGVGVSNVTFEPGCRNNWHVHHGGGQILLVTGGRGFYQAWGEPARELKPGDVVSIPPEVKHWHGAAPDSWFAHVAIAVPAELSGIAGERGKPLRKRRLLPLSYEGCAPGGRSPQRNRTQAESTHAS